MHADLSTNINNIKAINHGISKETCYKNHKDMLGSKNMLGKVIKHTTKQEKARKIKGCGL